MQNQQIISTTAVDINSAVDKDIDPMSNLQALLAPISDAKQVGDNLYYDPLYDQIKAARREDDPTLSQGVWETTFKKADWQLVENLCISALKDQTKDLQIAGWLVESWVVNGRITGLINGINLIHQLAKTYWAMIYPQIQGEDNERRAHLFEWLDITLTHRLVMLPILETPLNPITVNLANWMQAIRLEKVSKRSANPQKMLQKAEQQNELTLEQIYQILSTCSADLLEDLLNKLDNANIAYEDFKKSLDDLFKDGARPAMNELPETFKEMKRFLKAGLSNQREVILNVTPQEPESAISPATAFPVSSLNELQPALSQESYNRNQAYRMIKELGDFLQTHDPHSPAPALLKIIATWENKNISDIFQDFGNTPEDLTTFAKFLGAGSSTKKIKPVHHILLC